MAVEWEWTVRQRRHEGYCTVYTNCYARIRSDEITLYTPIIYRSSYAQKQHTPLHPSPPFPPSEYSSP